MTHTSETVDVDESADPAIYIFDPDRMNALRRLMLKQTREAAQKTAEAFNDLDEVVRRGTHDMQAIADALEARRKKAPPMWAQDPTKSRRTKKDRGYRRVK